MVKLCMPCTTLVTRRKRRNFSRRTSLNIRLLCCDCWHFSVEKDNAAIPTKQHRRSSRLLAFPRKIPALSSCIDYRVFTSLRCWVVMMTTMMMCKRGWRASLVMWQYWGAFLGNHILKWFFAAFFVTCSHSRIVRNGSLCHSMYSAIWGRMSMMKKLSMKWPTDWKAHSRQI